MGAVYRAARKHIGDEVAIKILLESSLRARKRLSGFVEKRALRPCFVILTLSRFTIQ
jgi:hypothetical protein